MKTLVAVAFVVATSFAIMSTGSFVSPAQAGFADRMSGKGDFASGGHQREMRMKQMQRKRAMMRQKRG